MSRCKHLQNVTLHELYSGAFSWDWSKGELPYEGCRESDLTGDIRVQCHDCGYDRTFGRNQKRPQWVKRLEAHISGVGTGEIKPPRRLTIGELAQLFPGIRRADSE